VADLVRASRRTAGGLAYASAGNGTPQHLAAELFRTATGADLRHVSYNGSAAALADVLKGQVEVMFCDVVPLLGHVESKRIRVLGVTSVGRQEALPGVAPIAECGLAELDNFEVVAWQCLVAPAGTPKEALDRLSVLLAQIMTERDIRERLLRQGVEPSIKSPEQLAAYIRAETVRWDRIIRAAGITAS
jgi:tripartite-type tricarboxylate transporter receptor subunit TctC